MPASLPKNFRCYGPFLSAFFVLIAFACRGLAASDDPLKADAAMQTAAVLVESKKYQQAMETLAPVLRLRPNDPSALNLKGAILAHQKDYAGAQSCYDQALAAAPGFFAAQYNLGDLIVKRQEWDAAITYFRNLLVTQPDNELIQYKLLLLLLRRNADPLLEQKLFSSETPTNTPAWYYARAARAYKQGKKNEARRYLDVAKSVFGDKTVIFQEELDESGLKDSPAR
jgi:tetratricopeptide (TPR) repeat protein